MNRRNLLVHYHIYKNSGTSFEQVLDDNYGDRHLKIDGPFAFSHITQDQLANIIEQHPSLLAYSSHQIHLPVPSSVEFRAIPVVFVRNPMLRIRSVYLFDHREALRDERDHGGDPLADFEEWVLKILAGDPNRLQLCNFQTSSLSRAYQSPPKLKGDNGRVLYDLQAAINNMSVVPCLARTEHFDRDVGSFEGTLERFGMPFRYRPIQPVNVSSTDGDQPIDTQVEAMKQALSPKTWDLLRWMNDQDLALYEAAHEMMENRLNTGFPLHVPDC